MALLVLLLSSVALAQACPCETSASEFTDLRFNCPVDNFCSDSLVAGSCGQECHASGSFHSSPYDDSDPSIVLGSHSCAGSLFDFNNGGSVLCAYSNASAVLSTSNACSIPSFGCAGCNSADVRYFDYSADYYQILCESGLIQYTYADNSTHEYDYRLYLNKNTCAVSGGEDSSQAITSVSCKAQTYELDSCFANAGSSSGVTGHCHFGTCWLYCSDNTKQLSFDQDVDGAGPRTDADSLVCESGFVQYGQNTAFHLECN